MKKSLAHLPQLKQDELELIAFKVRSLCEDVQMVVLFGSYTRGDIRVKEILKCNIPILAA